MEEAITLGLAVTILTCTILAGGIGLSIHGAIGLFRDARSGDWVMGAMLMGLALFLAACLIGAIMAYRYFSGPTFELLKAEWRCTATQVVADEDGDSVVCVQYSRR